MDLFETDKNAKVLIFSRKDGESVIIGDPRNPLGRVSVVSSHKGRVRLSFHFDESIKVNRSEVAIEILRENNG